MKLVLHIGTEKTGTTLLQNWLYANQQGLSDQGVFLSDQLGRTNNRKLVSYFQNHLDDYTRREGISSQAEKAAYFDGFGAQFIWEIQTAARDHHTMVITSEHFHSRLCGPKEIQSLAEFLKAHFSDIKILCYFREQSQMRESLYSTGLKAATSVSLEAFDADADVRTYYYNFYQIASRWAGAFGQENCDFRIYDRTLFEAGDLRRDFLRSLPVSLDLEQLSFEHVPSNESLSLLEGRMFRAINQAIPYWAVDRGGVNPENTFFKRIVRRCTRLNIGRMQDLQKSEFSARFRVSNRKFFDRFFDGENVFQGREPPLVQGQTAQLTIEEVSDIIENIMGVFCETLSERILLDQDANVLRDVALKYERGQTPTRAEALALMRLARRARPQGAVIQKKILDWEGEL
jgi:hypothetical protein